MPSEVDIINLALSQLGARSISQRTDTTKEAREADRIYDFQRDSELRIHTWNFSIVRTSLPALSAAPVFGYQNAFQLPSDFLRLIQAGSFTPGAMWNNPTPWPQTQSADYRIEGKVILTDYDAPLSLRYVARITDPNTFDSAFVTALACRLAMRLAETLTQSSGKRQLAQEEYKEAIVMAVRANAIESAPDRLPNGSWVDARWPG